ncbi:hypothetical protein SARC_02212 [Sphaeroforma arctica JP610]|uniref:ATP-grasp domain-containing protein n=1 Tax=Sphaeroforma arctica JP610 TaxID=667725 RepID=A0A0L0G9R2_9EUKA|nr:hypothetical protein SARC_02212 [Sphaeroforma arctica JP610]KNC85639.1 hypothetical protein SARC_02212 [Sphaeroforma arctica JP610]|eukprot:XP_014159541.1 hypothetical protein SARC_02212 [Sphaeroforma arctica JP610]
MVSLKDRSPEATAARLAAMKGKNMLLLSASKMLTEDAPDVGPMTKAYLNWAKDNGVILTYVTDENGDHLEGVYRQYELAHNYLPADFTSGETIVEAVKKSGITYDGVFSHLENMQPLVGEVAELLNISCNPADAYRIARSKLESRKALARAGLPTPRSAPIATPADIESVGEKVGFPLIIKPTSGAGSGGVYKADNMEEFKNICERSFADLAANPTLQFNPGMGDKAGAPLMAEQYLVPVDFGLPIFEFDVDLLMFDGEAVYSGVCDNWNPSHTYYLETGSNYPSLVPEKVQEELIEFSINCAKAMGFNRGAFHIECMYTSDGAQLIENNPRVGGGSDHMFHLGVQGVDMMQNFFMSMLNIPINPERTGTPQKIILDYGVNAAKTGILQDTEWNEEAKKGKYVTDTVCTVKAGDKIKGDDKTFPDCVALFYAEAPIAEAREAFLELLEIGERALETMPVTNEEKPVRRASRGSWIAEAI